MKHKKIIILLIFIILIVIIIGCFIKFSKANSVENSPNQEFDRKGMGDTGEFIRQKGGKNFTISDTCEVNSALTEDIELHATYYLSKVYVEEKQFVKKGEKILKYTNDTYLKAPYDCYIVELNIPEIDGKCLNSNYIKIESKNMLAVSMNVDEAQINRLKLGEEATIEIPAVSKNYTGYVTHIGSIANNGKFEVTIEFENDGNVKIGMTSNVKISIQ